ncbi:sulfotransferase 1A1-like isoform X1 [Babylonia areolata]|uniref:sulfotransferase 1A1-like isoform X1 n=1 Tax=Babylonia areolata TaxID=304850 RepID=UPI003FCF9C94
MPFIRVPDAAGKTLLLIEYGEEPFRGPPMTEEVMKDIHNIPIRDDDVILCSYPKTGCHWLWEMACMLRAGTTEAEEMEKVKYMMELMPQDALNKLPPKRVLNTHVFFRQLPQKVQDGKVKMLFIYRNPKDVAVSLYNHHNRFFVYEYQGEFADHFTELFLKGKTDYGDFFTYTRDWERVMDSRPDLPIFVLSYEELQADTFNKVKELAKFLGSSADEDTIRDIVDKCSFGSMQERKSKGKAKEWTDAHGKAIMFRKGKVGDWKNWFTVAQSEMMDQVIQKEMKGSRFEFQYTL